MLGPLTGPKTELVPGHSTVLGVRFRPGAVIALSVALEDIVDDRIRLADVVRERLDRLVESTAHASSPDRALAHLQNWLVQILRDRPDPLVSQAVRGLMPWQHADVDAVADRLALSSSQLRRRCRRAVGLSPKALQRTLRFQGFLAWTQAARGGQLAPGTDVMARLSVDLGYADQAHLGRECLRLTGLTPRRLLDDTQARCGCGHDHAASYVPFLAARGSRDRFDRARFLQDRSGQDH